jgi:rubrerythrin
MENYNHKQFIEWLNSELENKSEKDDGLLVEAKLSKYWKVRAKRRAKNAEREWPNASDRKWALKQQEKSQQINDNIQKLFEKELEESEDMVDDIGEVMRKIKDQRKKLKLKREAAKFMKPEDRIKANKGKSLSKSPPPHGTKGDKGVASYYRKAAKALGGAGVAPGESAPGGIMEEKVEE